MFNFNGFENWRDSSRFKAANVPTFAQISGGRTSGVIGVCASDVTLLFENTGREDPRAYEFLDRMDNAIRKYRDTLGIKVPHSQGIIWLEYRPPIVYGDPPIKSSYAIVNYETANRTGKPFEEMMEALAAFRKVHKNEGPVSPWNKSRICTSHLKHKVAEKFIDNLGIDSFETLVGLRADELWRVHDLKKQETSRKTFRCPLADLSIIKSDVLRFWSQQPFDLEHAAYEGNCDGCWMKKHAHLARILNEKPDPEFWFKMEKLYPNFGGRGRVSYAQLSSEYEDRLAIERALRDGYTRDELKPKYHPKYGRRFFPIIKEEKHRIDNPDEGVSCACEGSLDLPDEGNVEPETCNYPRIQ